MAMLDYRHMETWSASPSSPMAPPHVNFSLGSWEILGFFVGGFQGMRIRLEKWRKDGEWGLGGHHSSKILNIQQLLAITWGFGGASHLVIEWVVPPIV